ncbi:MAG: hypothetical protein RI907_378 [Pseudomonadota bacterium]|jgi:L-lactate dehydrogenase complex protein LldG
MSAPPPNHASARNRILGKLRAALAQAPQVQQPAAHPVSPADVAQHYASTTPDWPLAERLRRLVVAMRSVQTEVHLVRPADWPERLAQVVQAHGVKRLLMAPATPHGQQAQVALANLAAPPLTQAFDRDIEAWKASLFDTVDAGFTSVRCGIAETGSLVVWPDAQEPRTMSLVPPLHIALLDGRQVHRHLHEALTLEGWVAHGLPTNALLISGPSKTSDIQQTLAYGAHGPRALVLLLTVPEDVDLDALQASTGGHA